MGISSGSYFLPVSLALLARYTKGGYDFALSKGIEIIDFKAEVGIDSSGQIRLGDEWLTGDCCRFVETDKIVVGQEPPWADKQIVRDAAVELWGGKKSGPPLEFPEDVIQKCSSAYRNVFERITGNTLEGFQSQYF
jgi:phosphoribosylaminoimidazole-succinocarboxamide synthase